MRLSENFYEPISLHTKPTAKNKLMVLYDCLLGFVDFSLQI